MGAVMVAEMAMGDELFEAAVELAGERRAVSIDFLCCRLGIGTDRAGYLMEDLESAGVVGPYVSNVGHEVLET